MTPSIHLKALCAFFAAVCLAVAGGDLIAQEQASPLQLRHGYRMVLYAEDGSQLSIEQMLNYNGKLHWELVDEEVSPEARRLFERGRQAEAQGNMATAIELFDEAHQNAPGWEYPVSEAAWTYLLQGDIENAYKYYSRVDKIAPHGFMNSQQAVPCLRLELDGEMPRGTYRRLLLLQRASPVSAKLAARTIVMEFPDYAPGWERVAFFTEESDKALEAVEKGLAAAPDPFTRDSLKFRRAVIAQNDGDTKRAIRLLERLLKDPDLSVPVEAQIKILLPGLRKSVEGSQP